jgi:hypothetical protein
MEPWRLCRPVVADSHHFDEEQDPNPLKREKSDPDPHLSEKRDQDPHKSDADPQPWSNVKFILEKRQYKTTRKCSFKHTAYSSN